MDRDGRSREWRGESVLNPGREIRDRFRWVGFRRLLAGSVHAVRLYLTEPSARPVLDAMLVALRAGPEDGPGAPLPWASFGYGLLVGRKGSAAALGLTAPTRSRGVAA